MQAIDRSGSFLDVGCADGALMESVERWGTEQGLVLDVYGLELDAEAVRSRVPRFGNRVFAGDALGWEPPRRFDFVRTGFEHVSEPQRRPLIAWLIERVVNPGGRLIIGEYTEELAARAFEQRVAHWGFVLAGRSEHAHASDARLAYRSVWVDAPSAAGDGLAFRSLREQDLPVLQTWLSLPHVAEWWRQPLDLDGVRSMFRPTIDGRKPTHVYVIEQHAQPVGWIQWYRWSDYPEHAARIGAEPNTAGIDLAIGETELLGHGLGPRAVAAFLPRWVFVDPTITACITDPDERNQRSTRALEKAGFKPLRSVYDAVQLRTSLVLRLARPGAAA